MSLKIKLVKLSCFMLSVQSSEYMLSLRKTADKDKSMIKEKDHRSLVLFETDVWHTYIKPSHNHVVCNCVCNTAISREYIGQ